MKKHLLPGIAVLCLATFSFAQTDTVFYHTGKVRSQYGTGGAQMTPDQSKCVTRFTPNIPYPCKLVRLTSWFRNCLNPSQFNWVAFTDPTGAAAGPGNTPAYMSTNNFVNPAQGGIQDSAYMATIDLTSKNIILTSGDVYAGVTEHFQSNPFIGAGLDTANMSGTDRQWVNSLGTWYKVVNWIFADAAWAQTAYFVPVTATEVGEMNADISTVNVFPQPASTEAFVSFHLKQNAEVTVGIYNEMGQKVMQDPLANSSQSSGDHSFEIPVRALSAGIYFVRLESNDQRVTQKLVVVK